METIARSKNLYGPYEPNPANPILTNANSTEYCKFTSFSIATPKLMHRSQSKQLAMPTSFKMGVANGGVLRWLYDRVLSG